MPSLGRHVTQAICVALRDNFTRNGSWQQENEGQRVGAGLHEVRVPGIEDVEPNQHPHHSIFRLHDMCSGNTQRMSNLASTLSGSCMNTVRICCLSTFSHSNLTRSPIDTGRSNIISSKPSGIGALPVNLKTAQYACANACCAMNPPKSFPWAFPSSEKTTI